jgi:hypothetical protein
MSKPEDPCRDPASEARDDWEQLCQPLTDEERRENARKIEALSVPDRFALMFGHASETRATPETDREQFHRDNGHAREHAIVVPAVFTQRLERQRDEAREHAANAEASLKMAINSANARQRETEHAMRQRDELMEALSNLLEVWPNKEKKPGWVNRWIEAQQRGRDAIAAVKGGTP